MMLAPQDEVRLDDSYGSSEQILGEIGLQHYLGQGTCSNRPGDVD
jgi:hypothetical protein